jgi:hypothetical protein
MDIEQIRKSVAEAQINWQRYALTRMLKRNISRDEVREVISLGEIIEEYPLPSGLMFYNKIKPLHVVLSYNETNHKTYIITAYEPDLNHFEADFKTRRRQ